MLPKNILGAGSDNAVLIEQYRSSTQSIVIKRIIEVVIVSSAIATAPFPSNGMPPTPVVRTILILAANPVDTDRLRLDQEVREIEEVLRLAKQRDHFEVKAHWAIRPGDVQQALLDYAPQIVHFCGHGEGPQGLVFADEQGYGQLVSAAALANLFELFSAQVKCVLLNACYSETQAAAIVAHIDAVIGMSQAIGDRAAIEFAVGFYRGLGAGKDVEFAYKLGRNALELQSIPQGHIPILKQQGKWEAVSPPQSTLHSTAPIEPASPDIRIFISYKRNVALDESVALDIFQALRSQYTVFIDQTMVVGTPWAERIQAEIRQSDVLIVFLSEQSVHSEMVELEVRLAHRLASETGRPRILPVRLSYREPFQYPLSEYLNPLNWAFWDGPADTENLVAELQQGIAGGPLSVMGDEAKTALLQETPRVDLPRPLPSAQPILLESPEQGTMDPESRFYIKRAEDGRARTAIRAQEGTLIIKGARQMGKSSLLNRVMATAVESGRQVVFLDFQLFDQPALSDRQRFFRQFCAWLTDELDLPNRIDDYWQADLPLPKICTSYMNRHLLKSLETPMILAMDEVDRVFNTDFRSDFFSMLRSWHNKRATSKLWKRFSQILVISTEPYQLIEDLNQSPFNVGQTLRLRDFTAHQTADLNQRHGCPLTEAQVSQLMRLLSGHPYLVRRALYLLATQEYSPADFFALAVSNQGPFGEHLRRHLFRLTGKTPLVQGLMQIIQTQTYSDEQVIWRLEGAGLVKREGKQMLPRCQLYADYFREHVHV